MIGRTLTHYEVQEELSRGGMGVVYRALDTKLDRDVALKVLPRELVADEGRLRRFVQEAKAAASVHHPHVGTIHEIDEADGVHFIAMELIDGEKLSDVVARGALPVERVLELGVEMAEGLAKAHEKSVVHRDLKPANMMITEDGHVKIIDFGLAKLLEPVTPLDQASSDAETGLRDRETDPGQILGTVSYMSPEQARGEVVDHRTDIFSFGIVLYEMLTGKLPFQGKTGTDTLSAILRDPAPRLSTVSDDVASQMQHVLDRCLAKDRDERYQTAKDLLAELKRLKRDSESGAREPAVAKPRRSPLWLLAPAAIIVAAALLWPRAPERFAPRVGRTIQITREPRLELDAAISPDGNFVAYAAGVLGDTKIYVQQVAGGRPVALTQDFPGNHRLPRWSPDGTRIAFVRAGGEREHYSVPALGGQPRRFPWTGEDMSWSPDAGSVAYSTNDAIFAAPYGGGEPRKVTGAFIPSTVSFSPDGSQIAFTSGNLFYLGTTLDTVLNIAPSSLGVVAASGGEAVRITDGSHLDFGPVFSPDGRSLLFVSDRGGGRDIYYLDLAAPAEPQRLTTGLNVFTISLSRDGQKLGYSVMTVSQNLWSVPVPNDGPISVTEGHAVTVGNQAIEGVDISPDGQWLAFDSNRSGNQDIYKMPVGGGEPIQLTTDPRMDCCPSWSPDGSEIAFHSMRAGNRDALIVSADGGPPYSVTNAPEQDRYPEWSPDGRDILFWSTDRAEQSELYIVSREPGEASGETPRRLTFGNSGPGDWSPSGDRIAYSKLSGGVRLISASGGEPRIVSSFGANPRWDPDGETLYFRDRIAIWSIPASGGEPRMLVKFDDPNRLPSRGEWSTDGENFYFTLTEYETDVWVMELETTPR